MTVKTFRIVARLQNHYLKPSAKGNSSPPSRLARTSHVYGLFQAVPGRESTLNPFGVSLI
jgi:hypothetical protein